MVWIVLAVVCALAVSTRDYVIKSECDDIGRLVLVGLFVPEGIALLWLSSFPSQAVFFDILPYLAVSVTLNLIAITSFWKAIQLGDLSLVTPAKALTPVVLLFIAPLIVGEVSGWMSIGGAAAVAAGGFLLAPTASVEDRKALVPITIALICWCLVASVDAKGARATSSLFWAGSTRTLWGIVAALATAVFKSADTGGWDNVISAWKPLVIVSVLSAISAFTQLEAMQTADVVNVIAVKRLSILCSVVLGGTLLKEQAFRQRLLGAAVMVLGAILVSFGGV